MSEGSASKDDQREVDDDGAIGVRTDSNPDEPIGPEEPIGDADDSPGYTMEDYERVAAKPGVPSERELLLQMLWRLGRIEEQLEKGGHQVPQSSDAARLRSCSASSLTVCGGWSATSSRSVNSAGVFAESRKQSPTSVLTAGLAVSLRSRLAPCTDRRLNPSNLSHKDRCRLRQRMPPGSHPSPED